MELRQQVTVLKGLAPLAAGRDAEFCLSLISQFEFTGTLSPRQAPWVGTMIAKLSAPAPASTSIGDFAPVIAMFGVAKEHLKFPAFNLLVAGEEVKLYLAGPRSKYNGNVMAVSKGGYGQNKFYGTITPQGAWQSSSFTKSNPEFAAALETVLIDLAIAPQAVVAKYGKLTGRCCFCNLPLSDIRSTTAGYGKICADHYGLSASWKAVQIEIDPAAPKAPASEPGTMTAGQKAWATRRARKEMTA